MICNLVAHFMPILALQQTQALEFHSLSEWFFHITLFLLYLFFPMFLPLIAQCLASLLSGRDGGSKNRRSFCRCHWVGGRRYKVKSRKCTHRIRSLKRSFLQDPLVLFRFMCMDSGVTIQTLRRCSFDQCALPSRSCPYFVQLLWNLAKVVLCCHQRLVSFKEMDE